MSIKKSLLAIIYLFALKEIDSQYIYIYIYIYIA